MTTRIHDSTDELRQANSCLVLGAGLGAVGTTTALVAGATCPLCLILAPAFIGVGAWKRYRIRREAAEHLSAVAQDVDQKGQRVAAPREARPAGEIAGGCNA